MKASETTSKASICWNCKNARADRCKWVDKKEQVWERAVEEKRSWLTCDDETVYIVQECKHYDPENSHWRQKIPQLQSKPQKDHRRPYTPEDDAFIAKMREAGVPCGEIAKKLDRTLSAIYQRITRLKEMGMMEVQQDGETTRNTAIRRAWG